MPILRLLTTQPGGWSARAALALAALAVLAGPNGWFLTGLTPSPYDHQRVMMVLGLLGVVLLLFASPQLRTLSAAAFNRVPVWARWTLASFFALGLVSAMLAPLPIPAFMEWGVFLGGTLVAFAVAAARKKLGEEADGLLLALVLTGVVVYIGDFLAFFLPTVGVSDVTIFWGSPFFHFNNVRFLNQFQSWTLPLFAGGVVYASYYSRSLAALLGLMGSFWWALLLATGGRGGLVAAALSTLLTLLLLRGKALRWAAAVLALVVGGLVIYGLLFYQPATPGVDRAVGKSADVDHKRIQLWVEALRMAGSHPLLGLGPMQYPFGHPHNALLQLAAEWGLPATVAAVALAGSGLWAWFGSQGFNAWRGARNLSPREVGLVPALSASLLAGLGHGMVSGTLVMPVSQALACLTAGWMLGLHQWTVPSQGYPRRKKEARGLALTAVAAVAALIPGFGLTLTTLPQAYEAYREEGEGRFVPRFWLQGDPCLPPWPSPGLASPSRCSNSSQANESDT